VPYGKKGRFHQPPSGHPKGGTRGSTRGCPQKGPTTLQRKTPKRGKPWWTSGKEGEVKWKSGFFVGNKKKEGANSNGCETQQKSFGIMCGLRRGLQQIFRVPDQKERDRRWCEGGNTKARFLLVQKGKGFTTPRAGKTQIHRCNKAKQGKPGVEPRGESGCGVWTRRSGPQQPPIRFSAPLRGTLVTGGGRGPHGGLGKKNSNNNNTLVGMNYSL